MAKGIKTGGRIKGTPNKVSGAVRKLLVKVVDDYYNSKQFLSDLEELEAKDRISAIEKFTQYVAPRLQSTTLEIESDHVKTIEDRLTELSSSSSS